MLDYKKFLKTNGLKQVELANFLGITESAVSNVVKGKANLSEENLIKILENDRGWDVSMLQAPAMSGNINSVVNSQNFSYGQGGIPAQEFLAVVKENQRQMGQLIDTLAVLTSKIQ
jgi:transcriptional regulator with XRE-family HTH domain